MIKTKKTVHHTVLASALKSSKLVHVRGVSGGGICATVFLRFIFSLDEQRSGKKGRGRCKKKKKVRKTEGVKEGPCLSALCQIKKCCNWTVSSYQCVRVGVCQATLTSDYICLALISSAVMLLHWGSFLMNNNCCVSSRTQTTAYYYKD